MTSVGNSPQNDSMRSAKGRPVGRPQRAERTQGRTRLFFHPVEEPDRAHPMQEIDGVRPPYGVLPFPGSLEHELPRVRVSLPDLALVAQFFLFEPPRVDIFSGAADEVVPGVGIVVTPWTLQKRPVVLRPVLEGEFDQCFRGPWKRP